MTTLLSKIKLTVTAPAAILLTLFSLMFSCRGNVSYPARLVQADSLLYAHPDSAFRMLKDYADSVRTMPEATRMYYDLLFTTAQDKCYIKHTRDSLMRSVVTYYEHHGPQDKLARAYYVMGRVYDDMQNYPAAVNYYQKAIDAVPSGQNYILLALAYDQLGRIYLFQGMEDKSAESYKMSYRYAVIGKDSLNMNFAYLNMARSYTIHDNPDSAIYYYNKSFSVATDNFRRENLVIEMSSIYIQLGDYSKALKILSYNKNAYSAWALYYSEINKNDSAQKYYELSLRNAQNIYEKEYACCMLADYADKENDKNGEIKYLRKSNKYKDSILERTRTIEINSKVAYNNERLKFERDKYASEKKIQFYLNITLLSIFIIFIILVYVFYLRLRNKYIFKEEQNKRVEILNEISSAKERTPLKQLPLCMSIIQNSSTPDFKFSESEWRELHNEINKFCPDFVTRLRSMYPRITDLELTTCCLIKLGVQNSVIAKILNKTDSSVSNSRKRLYEKIHGQAGRPQQLDDFIRNLG